MVNVYRDKDLTDHIRSLEKRIEKLERTQRVVSLVNTVGSDFIFYAADGVTPIFRLGDQPNGDRGVTITRQSGEEAFRTALAFPGDTTQVIQFKDRNANVIFQDEWFGGTGLNFPKMSVDFRPVGTQLDASTTSTTFVDVHRARVRRQNTGFKLHVLVFTDSGPTQAEFQLRDGFFGVVGGTVQTHGGGATPADYSWTQVLPFGAWQEERDMYVQARVSAGAGTATVRVVDSIGD